MRLQKILSHYGICSRRKAELYITKGYVSVNGNTIKVLGAKANPKLDKIYFKGKKLKLYKNNTYIILNKPKGFVTSCKQLNSKLVIELIKLPIRLFPVGRLDKNSTGLLLITNDGHIHQKLTHPSFNHEKEYYVQTLNPISNKIINDMKKGTALDGKITLPTKINKISNNKITITLIEGKNRQIRRMINLYKNKVIYLKRIRINKIKIGSLKTGLWRYLNEKELKNIL